MIGKLKPGFIIEVGTLCGGSSLLFAHIMALYGIQGKVITFDVADASQVPSTDCYKNQYIHGFGHPLWEKCVRKGVLYV